jgi:hypothetical protein
MLDVLIPEQSFSSFGIEMVDLHSPTAPTIARKEAARAARKAYGKRKTRQVAATRVVRASKTEKNEPQGELQGEPPAKKPASERASGTHRFFSYSTTIPDRIFGAAMPPGRYSK